MRHARTRRAGWSRGHVIIQFRWLPRPPALRRAGQQTRGFSLRARTSWSWPTRDYSPVRQAALSLRFLGAAIERLRRGTARVASRNVAHPPEGVVAVTFVGHATMMVTTPEIPGAHH